VREKPQELKKIYTKERYDIDLVSSDSSLAKVMGLVSLLTKAMVLLLRANNSINSELSFRLAVTASMCS